MNEMEEVIATLNVMLDTLESLHNRVVVLERKQAATEGDGR